MSFFRFLPGLILAAISALFALSMALSGNWLAAALLLALTVLLFPPTGGPIGRVLRVRFARAGIAVLLIAIVAMLVTTSGRDSIYRSPEIRDRFLALYDEKMLGWPVARESIDLDTRYGRVHVIASGPEGASPMLLLHASGVASWSWKANVAALARRHRVYAVDTIGDAGKSEYTTLANVMKTGRDQADLYASIADLLGVSQAIVVGASEGGFIATNLALYHPERVKALILLGPMGYSGAVTSVVRIMLAQFFPLKSVQEATFRWAFSDNAQLQADYAEWFPLLMTGVYPAKVPPLPFSAQQRRSLRVPVLFVFGTRDNLVGDPEAAAARVADIPNVEVKIVDAGHLMGGEIPDEIDRIILGYAGQFERALASN